MEHKRLQGLGKTERIPVSDPATGTEWPFGWSLDNVLSP